MAAHPEQPVAASLDSDGTVLLWAVEPLQLLGPAFSPDEPGGLKHQGSMAILDSSLPQFDQPQSQMQPVQCVALCWLGLGEPAQEAQPVLACAMSDGAVKLLAVHLRSAPSLRSADACCPDFKSEYELCMILMWPLKLPP